MTPLEGLALAASGVAAGTINSVVGSGSLITFPVLIGFGYSPVLANVTNNIGVLPGSISGAYGLRRELRGQSRRLRRLTPASLIGGAVGAILLLQLPASAFKAIVPVLIAAACILVVVQPKISKAVQGRRGAADRIGPLLMGLIALTAVYGGYFGAAQGVLLLSILASFLVDDLARVNALKNVLAGAANASAAVVFIITSHIAWGAAGLIALGSVLGGQVGASVGRNLPTMAYRIIIVIVGIVAMVKLLA